MLKTLFKILKVLEMWPVWWSLWYWGVYHEPHCSVTRACESVSSWCLTTHSQQFYEWNQEVFHHRILNSVVLADWLIISIRLWIIVTLIGGVHTYSQHWKQLKIGTLKEVFVNTSIMMTVRLAASLWLSSMIPKSTSSVCIQGRNLELCFAYIITLLKIRN